MDVLVVLDGPVSKQARRIVSDNAWEIGFEAGIVVVPIVVSRERWEHGPEQASLLAMDGQGRRGVDMKDQNRQILIRYRLELTW